MKEYSVELLKKLVNIESVNGNEKNITEFIEKELSSFGLDTKRIYIGKNRYNVLAKIGNGKRTICFNAHADTVPPSGKSIPKASVKNGKVYGLGSSDDKGGIAAMLAMAKVISKDPPKASSIDILVTVDEEGDAEGAKAAIESGYRCDYAVVCEISELNILRANMGLIFLKLKTFGVSGHGSAPWKGENAIEKMFELTGRLKKYALSFRKNSIIGPFSLNLGAIKGGDIANRIPDYCEAVIDFRICPPKKSGEVLKGIKKIIKDFGKAGFELIKTKEPMETIESSPLINILKPAVKSVTGKTPKVSGIRGWTEGSSFRNMLGVDTVVLGPGGFTEPHSGNEFVSIEQLVKASKIYIKTAQIFEEQMRYGGIHGS
jgi:succinyl-diaminopimelate desuccinylase